MFRRLGLCLLLVGSFFAGCSGTSPEPKPDIPEVRPGRSKAGPDGKSPMDQGAQGQIPTPSSPAP